MAGVLLLDDVLSELDQRRRDFVLRRIRGGQVFITCCEEEALDGLGEGRPPHSRRPASRAGREERDMIPVLFTLLPLLVGAALEYTVCRLTMRETGRGWRLLRLLRLLPPLALLGAAVGIGAGRWRLWQSQQVSP